MKLLQYIAEVIILRKAEKRGKTKEQYAEAFFWNHFTTRSIFKTLQLQNKWATA